ncbi:MAG: preprotein translocase subunit SecG [Candidatus Omnitrophica bacterium]|nr:preprotein translocase subunit SecG [Candidatus Omnitrophota bacterium]MBI5144991.1 preprotein translocase subunit SecG [Candidatus Omnitrophota bacterium]
MIALIIVVHAIICFLLIGIILIQAGRGGGLVESFSGVESMFGTKTNTFLTRTTTVLSILFFLTCLSLAILAAQQSKSLMRNIKTQSQPAKEETPATEVLPQKKVPVTEGAPKTE